jgi:hypothetical protein
VQSQGHKINAMKCKVSKDKMFWQPWSLLVTGAFNALPDDGSHGVPKHVGGDFVQPLCINSSACQVRFMS